MDGKPNLAKDAWQSDADNGSNDPFAPTPKPDATSSWTHEVLSGSDAGADNKRQFSVLGQTLVFKGELTAEEDILIQGRVEGTITHNGNTLTIGPQGNVKANVVARRVILQGKLQGDVRASESVIVEASARVQGDIFSPRVGLKEGAKFRGRIDMDFDGKPQTVSPPMQSEKTDASSARRSPRGRDSATSGK